MDCPSLTIRYSIRPILPAPAATGFSSALNRRTPGSGRTRPSVFLKAFAPWTFRRCRIKAPAQFRLGFLLLAAGVFALAGCRQDMQNQPKFIPLRSNTFFPDQRSARDPIRGTVPRLDNITLDAEQLDPNSYYLSGRHGNVYGNAMPCPLTPAVMERGQQRFNIYCAPCHSRVGDGDGMIAPRGFKHPPSFHTPRLRNAPLGDLYKVL